MTALAPGPALGQTRPTRQLLARICRRGLRVVEVPVGHFPRRAGAPSGARPRVVARAFVELIRLHRRLRAG